MREFNGKRVVIEIDREKSLRSLKANNYYFGVLVVLAGHHLNKNRKEQGLTPLSKDQVHWVLKSAFLGCEETPLGPVPVASHDKDSQTFHYFMEKVRLWLEEDCGYPVPAPGEAVEMDEESA